MAELLEGNGAAWGPSLVTALEALQALATQRVAEQAEMEEDPGEAS